MGGGGRQPADGHIGAADCDTTSKRQTSSKKREFFSVFSLAETPGGDPRRMTGSASRRWTFNMRK